MGGSPAVEYLWADLWDILRRPLVVATLAAFGLWAVGRWART